MTAVEIIAAVLGWLVFLTAIVSLRFSFSIEYRISAIERRLAPKPPKRVDHQPILTSFEREAMRTGKSADQVRAERYAEGNVARATVTLEDASEFSAAVAAGIVAPTDPRLTVAGRGVAASRSSKGGDA